MYQGMGMRMEESLLSAARSARALHQQTEGERDQRPQGDGRHQNDNHTDTGPRVSGHGASSRFLVPGIGIPELLWFAALGYGVVWLSQWV